MDISLSLAKIIGVYGVIISISAMLNYERVNLLTTELLESEYLLYLTGIVALIAGLCIISVHNIRIWDYRLIITLVGWLAFIEGVILLLVPDIADKAIRLIQHNRPILIIMIGVIFIASVWLTLEGFSLTDDVEQIWRNLQPT